MKEFFSSFKDESDACCLPHLKCLVLGKTDTIVTKIKNGANGSQKWRSKDPNFRITIKFVSWSPGKEVSPTIVGASRIGAIVPRIL